MSGPARRGGRLDPMVEIDLLLLEDLMRHQNLETTRLAAASRIGALLTVLALVLGMLLNSIIRPQAMIAAAPHVEHSPTFSSVPSP
jgi:hypothetical protein